MHYNNIIMLAICVLMYYRSSLIAI